MGKWNEWNKINLYFSWWIITARIYECILPVRKKSVDFYVVKATVGFPLGERNGGNNADFFFTVLSKIEISHILMLSKKTSSTTTHTISTISTYTGVTTITATLEIKEKIRRKEK